MAQILSRGNGDRSDSFLLSFLDRINSGHVEITPDQDFSIHPAATIGGHNVLKEVSINCNSNMDTNIAILAKRYQ